MAMKKLKKIAKYTQKESPKIASGKKMFKRLLSGQEINPVRPTSKA